MRPETSELQRRLCWPALANVVVQAVLVLGDRVPSIDTLAYLESGTRFVRGNGYSRQGMPEVHFPPFVPVGLGALHEMLGSELRAVQVWNLLWGLALVAVTVAVAWRASGSADAAVLTAWAAPAVGGGVILLIRGGGGSEAPAAVLVLGAALVVLGALERAPTPPRLAGAGAAVGALLGTAYLVRPETLLWGLLLLAAALAAPVVAGGTERRARLALVGPAVLAMALLVFPYAARQHAEVGSWSLTAKSKEVSIATWADLAAGDRMHRDEVLHEIQPDGTTLGPPMRSLGSLAADDPAGWLGIVATNVGQLLRYYLLWQLIPIVLLVPAVVQLWRTRRSTATVLLGAVALGPIITSLLYFTLPRYLVVTTAVLVPYGCWSVSGWLARQAAPRRGWATAGLGAALALSALVAAWPLLPGSPHPERTDQAAAGRWIDANLPADAVVLTRSYVAQHHADRPVVTLPVGELAEVLEFGARRGATHLLADETTLRSRRPELVDDLLGDTDPEGLTLVHRFEHDGREVRIYALDGAPIADAWPLPLGYVSDPLIAPG